jgi:hydroxyethylthiazole kinase-like sugar kinase family protein
VNSAKRFTWKMLIRVGNSLTVLGCVRLILGPSGVIPVDFFAIGISSGIRVIASVAIAGCLLSAMGYGAIEYLKQ